MSYEEAIQTIKLNYPPENYTMLREALDLSIKLLEERIIIDKWNSVDNDSFSFLPTESNK